MPKFHIPTVGTLIFFEDTEGTVIGAMQYEKVRKRVSVVYATATGLAFSLR